MSQSYYKNSSDCIMLKHKTEYFNKINSRLLVKVFDNQASFIFIDGSIRIAFNSKHQLVIDNVHIWLNEDEYKYTNFEEI